jgi:hypothetical protein
MFAVLKVGSQQLKTLIRPFRTADSVLSGLFLLYYYGKF